MGFCGGPLAALFIGVYIMRSVGVFWCDEASDLFLDPLENRM